jgi:hypothetical protein
MPDGLMSPSDRAALAKDYAGTGRSKTASTAVADVLRLLRHAEAADAELGRLREPPAHAAGLMTAAALKSLRRYVGSKEGRWLAPAVNHVDALESLTRELYGVIADLHADDPGRQALLERGAAEMLHRVLALTRESFGDPAAADYPELADTLGRLRALGPARPPLPPSEAEREAARLRESLRACVEALDVYTDVGHGQYPGPVFDAIDAARAALEEDAR